MIHWFRPGVCLSGVRYETGNTAQVEHVRYGHNCRPRPNCTERDLYIPNVKPRSWVTWHTSGLAQCHVVYYVRSGKYCSQYYTKCLNASAYNRRRRNYYGRPSVIRPLTADFNETCRKYISCEGGGALLKSFKVRGHRSRTWPDHLTYNGGGIHFDSVALRLVVFLNLITVRSVCVSVSRRASCWSACCRLLQHVAQVQWPRPWKSVWPRADNRASSAVLQCDHNGPVSRRSQVRQRTDEAVPRLTASLVNAFAL